MDSNALKNNITNPNKSKMDSYRKCRLIIISIYIHTIYNKLWYMHINKFLFSSYSTISFLIKKLPHLPIACAKINPTTTISKNFRLETLFL